MILSLKCSIILFFPTFRIQFTQKLNPKKKNHD